jgi:hypothetical protein
MMETSLQEIFTLIPSTVSRYINFTLDTLLHILQSISDAAITWPKKDKFAQLNSLIVCHHPLLTSAFASIDGLNLPVQTSADKDLKNMTYNG